MLSTGSASGPGFGARLTLLMVTLVLAAVLAVSSVVFISYRNSHIQSTLDALQATGELNAASFVEWALARQDELRYLASLEAAEQLDEALMEQLFARLAVAQGFYDAIFYVGADGLGSAGVSYDGRVRVLPRAEARILNVADQAWFRQAMQGDESFSQPAMSWLTGNWVSTVAIPVRRDQQVVGVVYGSIRIANIFQRVSELTREDSTEAFLLDGQGKPMTPAPSLEQILNQDQVLTSEAGLAVVAGRSGVGLYENGLGVSVAGSYTFIPLLGWGLVFETPRADALVQVDRLFWTLLLVTLLIVVVAVLACLALVRSVVGTLGGDPAYAAGIVHQVAEGDLSTQVRLKSGDARSLLASIHAMQGSLRGMLGDVSRYSEQVAAAATELAQVSEETDAGMQHQGAQINSAAAAMNQMATTVEEVARNTLQAADSARLVRSDAADGRAVVTATVEAINHLASDIDDAAGVVVELKGDSDRIGSVLQVIRNIAEQTNLLALNAAIEAARAGESGRGFAVVADEVRSLASRTQDSISEIQATIEKLQGGAGQAEQAMHGSRESARQAVGRVAETGAALERITQGVQMIDDMMQQIASAAEQQTASAREINQHIHGVNQVAEQTGRSVERSVRASESLAQLARQLRSLVQQFRV